MNEKSTVQDQKAVAEKIEIPLLWHFTTQENLPKILLGNDGFLAGHTSFMSDKDDCVLSNEALAMIAEIVLAKERKPKTTPQVYAPAKERILAGAVFPSFVTCFTEDTRERKMWSEYTDKGGFAIGIDKEAFESDIKTKYPFVEFEKCKYETFEQQLARIGRLSEQVYDFKKKIAHERLSDADLKELDKLGSKILVAARESVFHKRNELSWEHEYRLIAKPEGDIPSNQIRFIGDKPFLALPTGKPLKDYVRQIRVSPFGDVRKSVAIATFVAQAINLNKNNIVEMTDFIVPVVETNPRGSECVLKC